MIDRRDFEASFRYAPFGFKILPTAHSFWVFPDCTFLDNSTINNLETSVIKTADKTMKITYTIVEE